ERGGVQLFELLRVVQHLVAAELPQLRDDVVEIARADARVGEHAAEILGVALQLLVLAAELTRVAVIATVAVGAGVAAEPRARGLRRVARHAAVEAAGLIHLPLLLAVALTELPLTV